MQFIIDIETNNLLQQGINYDSLPYKLKPDYKVWCVVIRNISKNSFSTFYGSLLTKANIEEALEGCTEIIGHNIVGFDLAVLKLYGLLDYTIAYPGQQSSLFGRDCKITDTLIWSKLLNADRLGGHSLEAWGKYLNEPKTDYNDWNSFSQEMLNYCVQDTAVNARLYKHLVQEKQQHDWDLAYSMELKLADLTLKQELFGFEFDIEKAHKNIAELTALMQNIAKKIDPILPNKHMSKAQASEYLAPKIRFKKDGSVSMHMQNFLTKLNATLVENNSKILYESELFPVTIQSPLKTHTKATVEDIDVVKSYLLLMGWVPTEVKERDLVKNQDKSLKSYDDIVAAIDRYVNQTESSLFKELRLEQLDVPMHRLRDFLISKIDASKPIYVPTTPKLTVGVEKEICPNLIALGEKAEFVREVVHYYTYRHRKNSIAGGVLDEDGEPETGFLSYVRSDGRIPTPADTLGANTGRYRHKIVCNVPRVTSLYGEQMRGLFKSGKGLWQLGYDFASLEARIMGHYVMPYTEGKELANALIAEKPNDIHSINARKLGIDRSSAKSFSYAAIYGAQPKKLSKMLGISETEAKKLFNDYWDAVPALKELKAKVEKAWERSGKKTILGLDGRLLNTRSKHSLINVLFQSGGAIAAKWSAVRLAQAMQQQDILGDPFKDSISARKVWWLIHMHDEQQLAVHPALLKIKNFASDDEAKQFVKTTAGCSAIGHGSKGAYVGIRTLPIDCIAEGIEQACTELNLRVELGFEYIPGLSWGQCH